MDFTVENAGTAIACREYAGPDVPSDAPALVCVHGACVDGVFFDGIARELSRDYRVIAYDRRGCGESSDAADGRYGLAVQAAELLTQIFENFDPAQIHDMLDKMHSIEHAADKKHHELEDALLTAFITPLEREDLDLMSCALDTVLDRIEGVVQRVYFTNIQSIHPDAIVIAHKVTDACRAMKDLMVELPNYRKSKTLRELVIQINTIESEADELYINAMRNLHVNGKDPLEVIAWRDVYAFLEYCADCCENVADVVDSIVMKNS